MAHTRNTQHDDRFFAADDFESAAGQPEEFYDALAAPKTLARFRRDDGAGFHCQPYARNASNLRMMDFFAEQLHKAGRR